MEAMGQGFDMHYTPQPQAAAVYARRYEKYRALGASVEQKEVVPAGTLA